MTKFYIMGGLIIALLLSGWQITSLRSDVDRLTVSNSILESNITSLKEQIEFEGVQNIKSSNRLEKVNEQLVNSELKLNYLRGIFNKHDFGNLLAKKPVLITNRMIKATKKVLEDLENASK